MKNWVFNNKVKSIRSLPVIVTWFIWKDRNHSCFDNFTPSHAQVTSSCLGMLSSYPQDNVAVKIRIITEEIIDKRKPRVYFDGSASGNPHLCGVGGILYLKEDHYFTFKAGLGVGNNNLAKLYAMKLLLISALDKQITKIQFFGDSMLVINSITGKFRIHNLQLAQILQEVNRLSDLFEQIDFKHIYRERNPSADKLANDGGKVQNGCWLISKFNGSERHDTYQIF